MTFISKIFRDFSENFKMLQRVVDMNNKLFILIVQSRFFFSSVNFKTLI